MAKNSNEGVLGSSATIGRLSTGDSVDLRKIVLQSFFGALSTIAKLARSACGKRRVI
jgi:uncharacterized membrane protein YjdF